MARQYKKRNSPARSSNMLGQLFLVMVVFVAGYMSASLYNLANVTAWVNTHVLAKNSAKLIVKPGLQQAQLPKPKFEFYTLLANEQVAGSAPAAALPTAVLPVKATLPLHAPLAPAATVALTSPAPVVSAEKIPAIIANSKNNYKDTYMVQVGSFKNMQEAERMKVSLVMKGFDVKIAMINQQNIHWYRVIIGPFSSKTQAQEAQLAFSRREHIMGMIRRMDA